MTISSIKKNIYNICYDVDRNITGQTEQEAAAWASTNSSRHSLTIKAIIDYQNKNKKKTLKVLNASGLSCGHQDFSIVSYLRGNTNIPLDWVTFESPQSEYLNNLHFQEYLKNLNISVRLHDFKNQDAIDIEGPFDVIIFTEIAEHLDHSALLRALRFLRELLSEDGILIITTPNFVDIVNRIKILLGNGDGPYWGDGNNNYEKGLYGHIVNYDIKRLKRLLQDAGFRPDVSRTFNYRSWPSIKKEFYRFVMHVITVGLSQVINNSKSTLFIIARKDKLLPIAYQI